MFVLRLIKKELQLFTVLLSHKTFYLLPFLSSAYTYRAMEESEEICKYVELLSILTILPVIDTRRPIPVHL